VADQEKILIVDDEKLLTLAIEESLTSFDNYQVTTVTKAEPGLTLLKEERYDLVITDINLPGMNGLDLLREIKEIDPKIEVILMTAYATVETAVEAMKEGAYDYLTKPLPSIDSLRQVVRKALDKRNLELEKNRLEGELEKQNKENVRLYDEVQQQAMKLSYINGISRAVNSMFDLSRILKAVLDQIFWIIPCENCFIILLDTSRKDEFKIKLVDSIDDVDEERLEVYKNISKKILEMKRPIRISGEFQQEEFERYLRKIRAKSLLAIPMQTKEQNLGVLITQTAKKNAYGEEDLTNALLLTNQVSIAIENALLFQEITTEKGKIEAILSSTSDMIIGTDYSGIVTIVNPAAQKEFGVRQEKVYGKSINSTFNNRELTTLFRQSMQREVAINGEVTITSITGDKTFYTSISPVKGLTGETIGRVAVMQDITHLKELDKIKSQELKRQKEEKKQVLQLFKSYVSPEVANEILRLPAELKLKGERRQVTVLFADVRSFTSFAEKISAEEVVAFLNDFFTEMTEIVFENKGTVDKFMGDCVMAIFGAPVSYDDDVERALLTALEMRSAFEKLKVRWKEKYGHPVGIAIGVNTGDVVAGNVGSDKKMDYTVIGDVVNFASRLEEIAKDGQIIMNESTYLVAKDRIKADPMGAVKIRGKAGTFNLYDLKGLKGKM
jgi:adenylate cyclase